MRAVVDGGAGRSIFVTKPAGKDRQHGGGSALTGSRARLLGLSIVAIGALTMAGCALPPRVTAPGVTEPDITAQRYFTAPDRYVTVDGTRLRVREEGPRGAPPIILIHGFSFSLESWDAWAADLSRDHRVIRFDLAGHGLSDTDARQRYGPAERVAMLAGLMDALRIRRATLAGSSFGGLLAWRLAAEQPQRVDRLILVDSAAYSIYGVGERPVPVPPATRAFLLNPTPAAVAFSAGLIFADPARLTPERLALMHAMIARPGTGAALVAHLERFTLPAPDAVLARITAPTLILWGTADRLIPVAQADRLAAAIPGARLIRYDGIGHAPHEEIPARTLADVRRFLSDTNKAKGKN